VRARRRRAFDHVLSTRAALAWAAGYARATGTRLRAVHVFREDSEAPVRWTTGIPATEEVALPSQSAVEDTMADLFQTAEPGPGWTLEFREGPVGPELVRASAGAALLVVGTHEHVGLERLMDGSVSHYCLSHARCPVAAVPPLETSSEAPTTAGDQGTARAAGGEPTGSTSPGAVVIGVFNAEQEANQAAVTFALQEAHRRGVPVRVVHGCDLGGQVSPETRWVDAELLQAGSHAVGLVAQRLRRSSRFSTPVETVNSPSSAVDALLAASESASVIVLQARPRSPYGGGGPGSTIRSVAARAACPVVVLRSADVGPMHGGVVVGVEEHGRAQAAIRAAMEVAERAGLPVTAVHAWEVPMNVRTTGYVPATQDELAEAHDAASRIMSEALAGLAEDFPTVELRRRVVRGPALEVLREVAADASLLVVARHTSSRLAFHALGRTARALLHDAPCPLMLTPPAHQPGKPASRLLRDVPVGTGY